MTANEVSIIVLMSISIILFSLISYSVGFKEGRREGYINGRAVSRHPISRDE